MGRTGFGGARNRGRVALGASCLAALCAFVVFTVWWRHLRPPLTGDEPHYLVIAHSIAIDRDLDVRDDYPRVEPIYPGLIAEHHATAMRADGRLRPIQGVGLGFVLAPAWLISSNPAVALDWARLIMILIAAAVVGEIHWLARRLEPERAWSAWAASATLIVALPFVGYSNQLYPEIPAAFLCITGLIASRRSTFASRVVVGTCAGSLLWLSPRYAPIALGILVWELLAEVRTRSRYFARVATATLAPAALLIALLCGWYLHAFGTLSLDRIYRSAGIAATHHNALIIYERSVGSVFDPVGGLLPYTPVLLLGFVGLGALWRRHRDATKLVCVLGIVYFLAFAPAGFRGYALTARMAIVTIPILALGIAALIARADRRTVAMFVVLGALSLAITAQSAHRTVYGRLYKSNLDPAAPIVAHTASIWPRFLPDSATDASGARRSNSARHAPVRRNVPVTGAWIVVLGAAAGIAARDKRRDSEPRWVSAPSPVP